MEKMKKVIQFKKTLSAVDVAINIVIGLIVLAALVSFGQVGPMAGLPLLITAGFVWLMKVLGFGISYTLIQIAENTSTEVTCESTSDVDNQPGSLKEQFIELYEQLKETDKVTDSMHHTFKCLNNGTPVRDIVLETAIEKLRESQSK